MRSFGICHKSLNNLKYRICTIVEYNPIHHIHFPQRHEGDSSDTEICPLWQTFVSSVCGECLTGLKGVTLRSTPRFSLPQ